MNKFIPSPSRLERQKYGAKRTPRNPQPRKYFDPITQPLDGYIDYNQRYLIQMSEANLLDRRTILTEEAQNKLSSKQAELLKKSLVWKLIHRSTVQQLTHEIRVLEKDMILKRNDYYLSEDSAYLSIRSTERTVEVARKNYEQNQGMYIDEALQDLARRGISTTFIEYPNTELSQ